MGSAGSWLCAAHRKGLGFRVLEQLRFGALTLPSCPLFTTRNPHPHLHTQTYCPSPCRYCHAPTAAQLTAALAPRGAANPAPSAGEPCVAATTRALFIAQPAAPKGVDKKASTVSEEGTPADV